MADDKLGITHSTAPDAYLDVESVVFGTTTVFRERVQIAGAASGAIAAVSSAQPATTAVGLNVRLVPANTSGEILVKHGDTVTVGSHAVTNAGTFAVQVNGDALTALQLIDNPVKVDDAGFTMASDSVMMAGFVVDETTPDALDEGDAGAARMSPNRTQYIQIRDGAASNERGAAVNSSNELSVKVADTLTVGSHAVTNAGTFAVQESGGALTALQIIDDWDESDRAKVNPIVGQAGISAASGNVAANTPRVTLAGDDRAVTALEIIDNAISGSEMQVDVVAALPAGTNNIGDVDIASIAAGDNNIGNVDIASIAAGDNNIGNVDVASIAAGDNNIGNVDIASAIPAGTNHIGAVGAVRETGELRYKGSSAAPSYAHYTATASGDNTIIASATGRHVILSYSLVTNTAFSLQWKDTTGSTLSGVMSFTANGGIVERDENGIMRTATGAGLVLAGATATGITGGRITYITVAS